MTVLDRVPVAAISARARRASLAVSVLAIIAAVFYVPCWAAARAVRAVGLAVKWVGAACAEGWLDGWRVTGANEPADG